MGERILAAVALHKRGELAQAEAIYREILHAQPRHFDALHYLGLIALQLGHTKKGIELISEAVAIDANQLPALYNLAKGLQQLGRYAEAAAYYERALRINPESVDLYLQLSEALLCLKRYEEVAAVGERGLKVQPDAVELHYKLSYALLSLQRNEEALAACERALKICPNAVDLLHNRGSALLELRRYQEAIEDFERVLAISPDFVNAMINRGLALAALNRYSEAISSYDQALALTPNHIYALNNRAAALLSLKRYPEALASCNSALAINPNYIEALRNSAIILYDLMRFGEAVRAYARLLDLAPNSDYVPAALFACQLHCCDWSQHDELKQRVVNTVQEGKKGAVPFSFLSASDSLSEQRHCAGLYIANEYPPSPHPLWQGERYRHDKIRIAYLSADFHNHATAFLMAGLFEAHDKQRFETIALSYGPGLNDEMRSRLQQAFDRFIDVRDKSDLEAAQLIRELEIDIAVDLKGFTAGSRTGILAHRAAPVQVNYLGYPGTLGAGYIDYIVADRHIISERDREHYAEQVVYLPDTYQVTDAKRPIAESVPSRAQAGLPASGFVFCSFNNNYKITPDIFDIWMRLLRQVPGSVLWLYEGNAEAAGNLRREAQARGVERARLVFAPKLPQSEHLARMKLADLFLDTLPVNAHTTASDALWAGLPVLTCMGKAFVGRVAGSLLHAIGLPELVTENLAHYEALALRLASEPALLNGIKAKLAANRKTFPLFDTGRFCRHLEAAYMEMWERYQRGEAPAGFSVHSCMPR